MYETIVRHCVSICQKGLVPVVFTAEKKKMCPDVLLLAR